MNPLDVIEGRSPWAVVEGDCLAVLRDLPDGCMDAVVTDPPAGISFMGKNWDRSRGGRREWIAWLAGVLTECRRVARPGAFMLCWALPRTSHWTGTAIEEAGWDIRDRVTHLFAQGMPKSKHSLKPAAEDWWLAKAPGPLAPLNVDACRIEGPVDAYDTPGNGKVGSGGTYSGGWSGPQPQGERHPASARHHAAGRWPANVVLDEEVAGLLDAMSETLHARGNRTPTKRSQSAGVTGWGVGADGPIDTGDSGGASRFFYVAKADRAERNEGLHSPSGPSRNTHETVKPLSLMIWLCRLITPAGGLILDPFAGSGTTGVAARRLGCRFLGIEQDGGYCEIARRRITAAAPLFDQAPSAAPAAASQPTLFDTPGETPP